MAKQAEKLESRIMSAALVKDFGEFEEKQGGEPQERGFGGGIIRRLVKFAVSIVAARAKRKNPDFDEEGFEAEVDSAMQAIGDGAIWQWLVNGGFEQILEWVTLILQLFMAKSASKK